jgi:alpha-glucosidase
MAHPADCWWRDAVCYQIYPRSFADAGGDGVGDLEGVIGRLDYLQWLGVDAIWMTPIVSSPNDDFGYDVSDFFHVEPELGDLATARRLVAEAGERGIRVILDIVPNHTSDRHPWFIDSRSSRGSAHRDWYVWADPKPDGSPPNNWLSAFGGGAWEPDPVTGQSYLHQYLQTQPDLNWWTDDVRDEFDRILRFWFDQGVAGLRIDSSNRVIKDAQLRDNPPAGPADHPAERRLGQRPEWTANRPEVHDVWRRWRAVCREYRPERTLIGETWLFDLDTLARYYGEDDDELHLNFNFPFLYTDFSAASLRDVVERTEAALGPRRWPVWTGGNHDVSRFPTRWCGNDARRTRLAMVMLLTLRGTSFLYYGDELGMTDVDVPAGRAADPLFRRFPGRQLSRDPERTPMRWHAGPNAGFTPPGIEPWLPLGDPAINVEDQRADAGSPLHLCRDLIRARRASADLRAGEYRSLEAPDGVWAYRRGSGTLVALNFADAEVEVPGVRGRVVVSSDRGRDGVEAAGELRLGPWEGAVVMEWSP